MTLFRKVFQNQSRPATEDEKLDDVALRKAFLESEEMNGPLNLDPFKPRARDGAPESWAKDAEQEHDEDADFRAFMEEGVTEDQAGDMLEPDEVETEEEGLETDTASDTDAMEIEVEGSEVKSTQNDDLDVTDIAALIAEDSQVVSAPASDFGAPEVPTDEDIVAGLGRALAEGGASDPVPSEPMEAPEVDHMGETEDLYEEVVAEDDSHEDLETDGPEDGGLSGPDPEETDLSVMRFAQTQLSAVPQNGSAPEMPQEAAMPPLDLSGGSAVDGVAAPAAGRAGRRAGRVKTRLLGFNRTGDAEHDPFGQAPEATATAQSEKYPVGWLVIVEGPGVGHSFSLFTGASMIGRGEDQVIRLDFGDNTISRNNHAAIAYDEEQNKFYIGHGGKSNIIRRNARPVLSTEELHHADLIRIGETTLRFVALCGSDFQWKTAGGAYDAGV